MSSAMITNIDLINNVIGKQKNHAIAWLLSNNISYGRIVEDNSVFLFEEPGDVQLLIKDDIIVNAILKSEK